MAVSLLAATSGRAQPRACLPDGWSLSKMAEPVVLFELPQGATPRLVAWRIKEDDRPLYVESAIVEVHAGSRWGLAHIFRHPRDATPRGWEMAVVYDAPQTPMRSFEARPTEAEVDQFLTDTWWTGHPDSGFRTLSEGRCPRP